MKKTINILIISALMLSITSSALAAESIFNQANTGFRDTVNEAYGGGEGVEVTGSTFINGLISIINALLTFTGIIFFLILIYAGWLWMNAHGNEEQITKAKGILRNVIIGLIVILTARLITELVLSQIGDAVNSEAIPDDPPD